MGIKMQKRNKENDPADQKKRMRKQKEKVWIAEVLSVLCVIAARASVVIRYGVSGAGAASYAAAMVSGEDTAVRMGSYVSDLYTCFLSVLFRFFGNKAEIAAFAQLILQCAAIFIFAAALKKLLGGAAVISFLLAASFVPHFLFQYDICSPDLLLCLLLGFVFYGAGGLKRSVRAGKRAAVGLLSLITCFLAGVFVWLILPDLKNMTYASYTNLYAFVCLAAVGALLQGIVNGFGALRAARRKKRAIARTDATADDKKEADTAKENAAREDASANATAAQTAAGEKAPESEDPDKPKIDYIPNPLPLPKKHVKKVMGFDINTDAGDRLLDFDYQGTDEDDFDI